MGKCHVYLSIYGFLNHLAGVKPGGSFFLFLRIVPLSEGASATDPNLQDLHDTGQQEDI